jgi:hypothetical protein
MISIEQRVVAGNEVGIERAVYVAQDQVAQYPVRTDYAAFHVSPLRDADRVPLLHELRVEAQEERNPSRMNAVLEHVRLTRRIEHAQRREGVHQRSVVARAVEEGGVHVVLARTNVQCT